MKRLRIFLGIYMFLELLVFGFAVTVRSELWAQIFVGGCALYSMGLFVFSMFTESPKKTKRGARRFDMPSVSVGDVIYDLQEYVDKLPCPEILELVVEEVALYIAEEDGEAFYHINGRIFPVDEFMKTWFLEEATAEELAYGLRKDW